jgi:acetyltransferase-like isoleucine patch superfamily enzyme
VSTRAVVNGGCRVGRGSFIGSGAILRHNTTICPGAIIGAGAVVVNDIDEVGVYVGNPARKIP